MSHRDLVRALSVPRDRDRVVTIQDRRLREIVRHAYETVPFYRRLFDREGLSPREVRGVEDLTSIPIIAKEDLRAVSLAERMERGTNPDSLLMLRTSGSTGRPFEIRRTLTEARLLYLHHIRSRRQYGLRLRDRDVRVALARVAPLLEGGGYPGIRPRYVAAGGEPLLPHARRRISRGFRAPVFDVYGTMEFGLVAWECPQGGPFHTCDDGVIVEVVRDGVPVAAGERGEVVVTGLLLKTVPFIRYRVHDIATRGAETCACGQPFSTLSEIQGRALHYLEVPGIGWMHPFELTGPLIEHETDWIDQFQLVQESASRLQLRISPLQAPTREAIQRIEKLALDTLGSGIHFETELVDELPPDPSGKFRPFVSLLPDAEPEFDGYDLVRPGESS
jgi:phenylacetate-CoA ligase